MGKNPKPKTGKHPDSIKLEQEAFRDHYTKDHNPLNVLLAFNHAHEEGIPLSDWVVDRLYVAFSLYLEDRNKASLDSLLGLTPRGPGTVKDRWQTRNRNIQLAAHIDSLVRKGMRVEDATFLVWYYFRNPKEPVPSTDKLRIMYFGIRKDFQLDAIKEYPRHWLQDIFERAPNMSAKYQATIKRYSQIFVS